MQRRDKAQIWDLKVQGCPWVVVKACGSECVLGLVAELG